MLIIAIPKSASTSLMHTLGSLHNLPFCQKRFGNRQFPDNLILLPKYHSDIRELTGEDVSDMDTVDMAFKQHIPPTNQNIDLLKYTRKVILLRPPVEIIEAYFRAEKRHLQKQRTGFEHCKTISDWQTEAVRTGLLEELEWFYETWMEYALNNKEVNLIVTFKDLVENQSETINRIEEFFQLPISTQKVKLSKKRYSRHNKILYALRKKLPRIFSFVGEGD